MLELQAEWTITDTIHHPFLCSLDGAVIVLMLGITVPVLALECCSAVAAGGGTRTTCICVCDRAGTPALMGHRCGLTQVTLTQVGIITKWLLPSVTNLGTKVESCRNCNTSI